MLRALTSMRAIVPMRKAASEAVVLRKGNLLVPRAPIRPLSALAAPQAVGYDAAQSDRVNVFTAYVVYKRQSALSMKVIRPRWEPVNSASGGNGMRPEREGTIFLEFANARGEREYDWAAKESFSLSATECAEILEGIERREARSMVHDPNMMKEGAGTIIKTFQLSPSTKTGDVFFNLSVTNKTAGTDAKFGTPLSPAEARVVHTIFQFAIPRLLGIDEIFAAPPLVSTGGNSSGFGSTGPPPF